MPYNDINRFKILIYQVKKYDILIICYDLKNFFKELFPLG